MFGLEDEVIGETASIKLGDRLYFDSGLKLTVIKEPITLAEAFCGRFMHYNEYATMIDTLPFRADGTVYYQDHKTLVYIRRVGKVYKWINPRQVRFFDRSHGCQCGADSVNSGHHSDWCEKYEIQVELFGK